MFWSRADEPEHFVDVPDEAALDAWLARPGAVLLLLHDPGCPVSLGAYFDVARIERPIALLDVRANPALADAVEARTGIRHESPQAILLRDGEPVWSASHWGVTAAAITAAVQGADRGVDAT